MPIFQLLNLEYMYIDLPKSFLWKSTIYHSIKLAFDVEVAAKFLNGSDVDGVLL
jgi:hypothetical protein